VLAVVNCGVSNLRSVLNALEVVGAVARVVDDPGAIEGADGVILPGVGAFRDGIANLERAGFPDAIRAYVDTGRPLLGICLGMQLLAERSEEYGDYAGLGLIPGSVVRIETLPGLRIPHVGWNTLDVRRESVLFDGLSDERSFYFVHSYHLEAAASEFVTATTDYGLPLTACVQRDNVHGVQFHPEKSQRDGLKMLSNFVALAES
jgi:imidazole glycerol-phosphate synthase subunit HisH